ncbi:MAG: hypothetical protein HY922_11440 [Elusimicrobia bacterium]|nr:hypothetical protein [Elusimicrobiota bacterium]
MKRWFSILMALVQLAWEVAPAAAQAVVTNAGNVQASASPVQIVPVQALTIGVPVNGLSNPIQNTALAPVSGLASLYLPAPARSHTDVVKPVLAPQTTAKAQPVQAVARLVAPVIGETRVAAHVPADVSKPAPAKHDVRREIPALQTVSEQVQKSLEQPGFKKDAPAESSKGSAEKVFADLHGDKLVSGIESEAAAQAPETLTADLRPSGLQPAKLQAGPVAVSETVPVLSAAPAPAQAKTFWQKPAVRLAAGALAAAALAATAPLLAAHVGLVAAAGSITLSVIGIPQIITNFKMGREGVKDVVLSGPLMWFAAASLLSLVSIGQGSSLWWNAANVAGVVESLAVIGQLNYFKRDARALKATLAAIIGTAIPVALIATQALLPLSAGLTAAFTAAMGILWVLDAPQIRRNYLIFRNEGRAPKGISPLYKILLIAGSLMHLFAALMGGDLRWAFNAIVAVVMGGTVLAQMYLPRAANAALGPVVRAAEKAGALGRGKTSAPADGLLADAQALVKREFRGTDYPRFKSADADEKLASLLDRVQALPGRSAILLEAPTAAGKSTLAEQIHKTLKGRIAVFPVDRYFKPPNEIAPDPQGRPDYDRPDALYLDRAAQDLKTLLAGGRIELPRHVIDGPTTFDSGEFLQLGPDDVVIVDSIFASHEAFLKAIEGHSSLNVYLAAPTAVRLARRLKRDKTERGIAVGQNLRGWAHLLVNERANILPLREKADVVLNLMSAQELERLPQAYAELLAQEWAANGRDARATELFLKMLSASIEADRTPSPLPAGDLEKALSQVDVSGEVPGPGRLKVLVAKALETYAAVQDEARDQPNFSGFHVHAAVELSDGRWASAPNVELSREVTLCAERAAILAALAAAGTAAKVRAIVVSNSGGDFKKLCAECLSWLATGKFFTPDTQIVSVSRDPVSGRFNLRIRALKSILPFHMQTGRLPSTTQRPVGSLEVALSENAARRNGYSKSDLKSLMEVARRAYERGAAEQFSAKPSAAAVRLAPFGRASAVRFQWAPRFTEAEDLQAAASALERAARLRARILRAVRLLDRATFHALRLEERLAGMLRAPAIDAIAYYGQDFDLPPIASLGRLVRQGATPDTLILRIENDRIQARTLGDYMTEIYGLPK